MSTRQKLDFLAIKEAAPIVKVAQLLNLELKRDTAGFRCPCPSGKNGNPRAIKITPGYQNKDGTLGAFFCHACRAHGDCIGLYAHIQSVENYEAALALAEHFGVNSPAPQPSKASNKASSSAGEPLKPLDYLEVHHEVLDLLGLSPEVCAALGAGYAPKGTMNGRVVIPLRLEDGTLCGYFGIATKPEQAPLLKFPPNLEDKCGVSGTVEEPAPKSQDEMRKLLRVV